MTEGQSFDPSLSNDIKAAAELVNSMLAEVSKSLVGQQEMQRRLVIALITDGHILLEGVPGLGKTLAIKSIAQVIEASFQRIQFTPDLLPADIVGTEVFRPKEGTFEVRKGPVFANFVLADEINRAPAKVQSALLETMQERQVTLGTETFTLPNPFLVMATQNPIEQEGTYPLPEAQIDRFMMKVRIEYPSASEEKEMLELLSGNNFAEGDRKSVATLEQIANIKSLCHRIYVDERLRSYIINIISATRAPKEHGIDIEHLVELGGSPRATISLFLAARADALLNGEHFVVPQNIKNVAHDVLRHRVTPTYEAEAEGLDSDHLIEMILERVEVP